MTTKTYPYKPKLWLSLMGLVVLALSTGWFVDLARSEHTAASRAMAILASVVMGGLWVGSVFMTWSALAGSGAVRLLANRLEAPTGPWGRRAVIAYAAIRHVRIQETDRRRYLYVAHRHGQLVLNPTMLPRPSDIDEIHEWLLARIAEQQPAKRPSVAELLRAVQAQSKDDGLIGAKLGGQAIWQRLYDAMDQQEGVNVHALLCMLGSLAGHACQVSLRAQALRKGLRETALFVTVTGHDGRPYFHGDLLNLMLFESPLSVWAVASARHEESRSLVDVPALFKRVAASVGGPDFGVLRLPDGQEVGEAPLGYVRTLWPALFPLVKQFCPEPEAWPVLYAFAIQDVIESAKAVVPPHEALNLVMACAIPMSKVDLARP